MSRRPATLLAALVGVALLAAPASGYVHRTLSFVDGAAVVARWAPDAFPVAVTVSPGLSSDIEGSAELSALTAALNAWSSASDSAADLTLTGEAPVVAGLVDGINAIEFSDDPALDAQGAIALTFAVTDAGGVIQEADILVNDRHFDFSADGGTVGLDLQTALTRELGHFLGLDSSPVGAVTNSGFVDPTAVMFPVARGEGELARELTADDVAGLAALYPAAGSSRGSISGTVTRGGQGVFGAHVVVFDPVADVLVGGVTLPDGSFTVGGLPPGRYLARVQALRSPAGPATLGGIYADDAASIDTTFRATFLGRAIDVAAGGQVSGVSLEVQ